MPSTGVWTSWNTGWYQLSSSLTTMGTAAQTCAGVWENWNQSYGTMMITSNNMTVTNFQWGSWNDQWETVAETEAQRLRREQHAAEARQRAEDAQRVHAYETAKAERTARELLLAHLDAQQKRDALEHGWFEVLSDKGRRWRIRMNAISGNVDLMPEDGEARLASYCAHAREQMPASDHHLIQKLILEADEEQFTSVANIHYLAPGADPAGIPDRRRTNTARLREQVGLVGPDEIRQIVAQIVA
jgi:hypothetical protein